jgi:hypothetical protein
VREKESALMSVTRAILGETWPRRPVVRLAAMLVVASLAMLVAEVPRGMAIVGILPLLFSRSNLRAYREGSICFAREVSF